MAINMAINQGRMQEFSKGGVLTQGTQGKGGVQNICPDTNALIGKNKGGGAHPRNPPPGSATVYSLSKPCMDVFIVEGCSHPIHLNLGG